MDARSSFLGIAGWGTTLALLLGWLSSLGSDNEPPPAPPPAKAVVNQSSSARGGQQHPDSQVAVTGTQLLQEFLGENAGTSRMCVGRYRLGVLFVTVPDPIDSHLDWAYDAQLNATRRALERDSYVIDRFWVPWTSPRDTSSAAKRGRGSSVRAEYPGVMLFRRSTPGDNRLRLIYVVGEIPTAGVHKTALFRALTEGDSLLRHVGSCFVRDSSMGQDIRVVGPAFSGSAPSLRLAIDSWRSAVPKGTQKFRIISGSASNTQNPEILTDANTTFSATVYDDRALGRFHSEVLKDRMHIRPNQTAMLREVSTQYGQLSSDSTPPKGDSTLRRARAGAEIEPQTPSGLLQKLPSGPIQIPFPMHISELREQYARNPDQLIIGRGMPGERPAVRLPVKLEEGARLADGPAVVSELTPPSVDAMLDDIARSLNAHHVKAVGILATDARDVIFLGTEVRKRVRDVLLFTYGSNALYARPDVSQWLRGMLVISTYPAAVESQFWDVTQGDRQRVSFSGDMAEGMYNAVLMQLGDSAARVVTDYAHPLQRKNGSRPPIWITTVGSSSMLPVALLDSLVPAPPRNRSGFDTAYVLARPAIDSTNGSAEALAAAQEGQTPKSELGVFVILLGIGFAWILRDQIVPRYEALRRRDDPTRTMQPADVYVHLGALRAAIDGGAWRTDWPLKSRIAQTSSLLVQHELYTVMRVIALTLAFIATLILLLRVRSHGPVGGIGLWVGVVAATVAGLRVALSSVDRIWTLTTLSRGPAFSYFGPHDWPSRSAWRIWIVDALGRSATLLAALACLVFSVALLVQVTNLSSSTGRLFFYRSTSITGGVTPGIPLLVAGVLFYAWCIWNLKRVALLLKTTAFEQLYFDRQRSLEQTATPDPTRASSDSVRASIDALLDPASGPPRERVDTPVVVPRVRQGSPEPVGAGVAGARAPTHETPSPSYAAEPTGARLEPIRERRERRVAAAPIENAKLREYIHQVRSCLFLVFPGAEGMVMFVVLAFMGMWAWSQFNVTIDALVLNPFRVMGIGSSLTSFDVLLRMCVLGGIGATLFGVFRLVNTWLALREALQDLAEMPLVYAFDGLPLPIARLTRLGPGDQPTESTIAAALSTEWGALERLYDNPAFRVAPTAVQELRRLIRRRDVARTTNVEHPNHVSHAGTTLLDPNVGTRLSSLVAALQAAWKSWPGALALVTARVWDSKTTAARTEDRGENELAATSASTDRASIERVREIWLMVAGHCTAVYVVEYIEWVIHHLRNLAAFLLTAIILVNVLLASYPFQPQSALKAVFLGVTVLTVGGLVFVLVQINRNDVLSLITRTDPGRVNWSGPFALNMALYILLPLAALLSTEFPFIREVLFSWVNPLLRAVGKG